MIGWIFGRFSEPGQLPGRGHRREERREGVRQQRLSALSGDLELGDRDHAITGIRPSEAVDRDQDPDLPRLEPDLLLCQHAFDVRQLLDERRDAGPPRGGLGSHLSWRRGRAASVPPLSQVGRGK